MDQVAGAPPVMQIGIFQSFSISVFEIRIRARKISSLATALILYLVVNIKEILCFP